MLILGHPISHLMKRTLLFGLLLVAALSHTSAAMVTRNLPVFYQKIQHPKQAMPDKQAKEILKTMQHKGSDEEKLEALKAGVKDKGITVEQLTDLLNQFNSDASKLDGAKFAYPYTVNYKDYFKIKDLFGEEESKQELETFIRKNK